MVLDNVQYGADKDVLLKVVADKVSGIRLINTDTKKAQKDVELGIGVKSKVVSQK